MKIILKSVLVAKSAVFVTSQIHNFFNYLIKENKFLFTLAQDYFLNTHPN